MTSLRTAPPRSVIVEVRTPARAHLGMLSFGNPACRSFGGVGVMLDRPGVHLRMRRADRYDARGEHAERALQFARDCAEYWSLGERPVDIEIVSAPRPHVGLGSGTQLGLAVAAAVRRLADLAEDRPTMPEETSAEELARASGRGLRSCVGVHGFTRGGLIVEAGRRIDAATSRDAWSCSPLLARVHLPTAWRCVVIVDREAVGLHGEAERAAFRMLPPMAEEVTAALARIALLDLLPAATEGRFDEFAAAVHRYGRLAGAPFEQASRRLPHADATVTLLHLLGELGVVGRAQSSWGPAVIACCESADDATRLVEALRLHAHTERHEMTIARFDTQGTVIRDLC